MYGAELRPVRDEVGTRTIEEVVRYYGHWKRCVACPPYCRTGAHVPHSQRQARGGEPAPASRALSRRTRSRRRGRAGRRRGRGRRLGRRGLDREAADARERELRRVPDARVQGVVEGAQGPADERAVRRVRAQLAQVRGPEPHAARARGERRGQDEDDGEARGHAARRAERQAAKGECDLRVRGVLSSSLNGIVLTRLCLGRRRARCGRRRSRPRVRPTSRTAWRARRASERCSRASTARRGSMPVRASPCEAGFWELSSARSDCDVRSCRRRRRRARRGDVDVRSLRQRKVRRGISGRSFPFFRLSGGRRSCMRWTASAEHRLSSLSSPQQEQAPLPVVPPRVQAHRGPRLGARPLLRVHP